MKLLLWLLGMILGMVELKDKVDVMVVEQKQNVDVMVKLIANIDILLLVQSHHSYAMHTTT